MNKKMMAAVMTAAMLMISASPIFAFNDDHRAADGAVYTMTNDASDNQIVIYDRDEQGLLTFDGSISTGGSGSGGGLDQLGSQGSLALTADNRWLLAVNAGSDDISVFRVTSKGPKLVDKAASGGTFPVSLAVFHNLVYVLNAGTPNITGYFLSHRGQLIPLNGSTRLLGSGAFAQVGFDPRGEMLVVTDRGENEILVYQVDRRGLPSMNAAVSMSNGLVPFGFTFDRRGHLLVSEAGSGAASSYRIQPDGTLSVISPSVANGQAATCWIAANMRGDVFTANTASGTVSAYQLMAGNGQLTLLNAAAGTAGTPVDMAITENSRFLYALDPMNASVHMYRVERGGSLVDLGAIGGGLFIYSQGIAAR